MKKFLKTLFVIVLILGSVAGTTYFFFSQIAPKTNYFVDISSFVTGANSTEFSAKLKQVAMNSDTAELGSTNRFNTVIEVNNRLNSSLLALNDYMILAEDYDFDYSTISNEYVAVVSAQNKTNSVMDEYLTKLQGDLNKVKGANDVYSSFANYIVKYSEFLNALNEQLKIFKINKNADLKYSLIEIYANICINSYSKISKNTDVYNLIDPRNIQFINSYFKLTNSYIDLSSTNNSNFSLLNNQFIKAYNACNKVEFANNLYKNVGTVGNEVLSNYSKELVASVYFKNLFEV